MSRNLELRFLSSFSADPKGKKERKGRKEAKEEEDVEEKRKRETRERKSITSAKRARATGSTGSSGTFHFSLVISTPRGPGAPGFLVAAAASLPGLHYPSPPTAPAPTHERPSNTPRGGRRVRRGRSPGSSRRVPPPPPSTRAAWATPAVRGAPTAWVAGAAVREAEGRGGEDQQAGVVFCLRAGSLPGHRPLVALLHPGTWLVTIWSAR